MVSKDKKVKVKLHDRLQYINKQSDLKSLLFCLKTNYFHTLFNAVIGSASIAVPMCLAGELGAKPIGITALIFNVLLTPALVAAILATLEFAVVFLKVINTTYTILNNPGDYNAQKIDRQFRDLCVIGSVVYALGGTCALLISKASSLKDVVAQPWQFYITGIALSLVFGIVWNLATYYRLRRINYKAILKIEHNQTPKEKFKIIRWQFSFEVLGNIISATSMIAYYYLADSIAKESPYYTLFYVIYFTVLWLYVKQVYSWEFNSDSCNEVIYSLKDIFNHEEQNGKP